jgi:hypothetical protein
VSTGGGRRGRRDNGLVAAEYAVAGDVDPRVGEHLLDVLAAGGIAAYLQPASDMHPVTRTTTLPARPTDRLYVDREHVATARDYLAKLSPEAAGSEDVDDAWARIVASYDADVDRDSAPWPESENVPPVPPRAEPADSSVARLPVRGADEPSLLDEPSLVDGFDTFGADLPDDDETYTPPPPPPLPRPSAVAVLATVAIVVGFLLFIRPSLAPIDQGLAQLVGFVAVLVGVATLIWRLRPGTDEEDEEDPDNGAVV